MDPERFSEATKQVLETYHDQLCVALQILPGRGLFIERSTPILARQRCTLHICSEGLVDDTFTYVLSVYPGVFNTDSGSISPGMLDSYPSTENKGQPSANEVTCQIFST